jgi:hypothetical protein
MSLARLRRDQGRRIEARDFLAPVYGWSTEGFDTQSERCEGAAGRAEVNPRGVADNLLTAVA